MKAPIFRARVFQHPQLGWACSVTQPSTASRYASPTRLPQAADNRRDAVATAIDFAASCQYPDPQIQY